MESGVRLQCTDKACDATYGVGRMIFACTRCGKPLQYSFSGPFEVDASKDSLWKFKGMIAAREEDSCSLGEGNSPIIEMPELSPYMNGAKFFLMLDMSKNPTGVFKDREASIVISQCKKQGLDNLVFYSTANTGRSYTHYAAHAGLTTYFFMPAQCHYKNTDFIRRESNNHIIYVDDHYPEIAPFAKKFAAENDLNLIAPMHDRTESYATVAYEQFTTLPECTYFVQTIASGMGPIGFTKGHDNLIKIGVQTRERVPRVIAVQSSELNSMTKAYNAGREKMSSDDLPKSFPDNLFEPTLNSTNPVNNYPDLRRCLDDTRGIITDVTPGYVKQKAPLLLNGFKRRQILVRTDVENSVLIEFAGILKLAEQKQFTNKDVILMLACGRGRDTSHNLLSPDIVINPRTDSAIDIARQLKSKPVFF